MVEEIWKDIKSYEGLYAVSNKGNVKRLCSFKSDGRKIQEHLLKPWKRSKYLLVDLWRDSKRDVRSIHVLVYETFNDCSCKDCIVHHKNEDKYDNRLENLECLTVIEHNRLHFKGKQPWNKGKTLPPEVLKKAWETRRAKKLLEETLKDGQK